MAYDSCNVTRLKSALNTIDNINYNQISELINSMSSTQWQSPSRQRIIDALNALINEYKAIQTKAASYKTIAGYIDDYKDCEDKKATYNSRLNNYKKRLKNCDDNDTWGKKYLQDKINEYNRKIRDNNSKMNQLKNKINV